MKAITKEQFDKLPDCEVESGGIKRNRKFVRRGLSRAVVATEMDDGSIIATSVSALSVSIAGRTLKYIPKYSFTNPKKAFID